jgi:hypothetical protein
MNLSHRLRGGTLGKGWDRVVVVNDRETDSGALAMKGPVRMIRAALGSGTLAAGDLSWRDAIGLEGPRLT